MPNILIRRCAFCVVRHGGWSWGADPQRLISEVVGKIPALLAEKLVGLFPEEDSREFAAPIRLRIPVRISELSGGLAAGSGIGGGADDLLPAFAFEQRLDGALRAAFGLALAPARMPEPVYRFAGTAPVGEGQAEPALSRAGGALPNLLLGWAKEGALERRLAALSDDQIAAWHEALLRAVAERDAAVHEPTPGAVARIYECMQARAGSRIAQTESDRLRQRIVLASEAAGQFDLPLTDDLLWQALERLLPLAPAPAPGRGASTQDDPTAAPGPRMREPPEPVLQSRSAVNTAQDPPRYAVVQSAAAWEVKIDCGLPFLLLGPLTRLGYVGAVAAVLEAARLTGEAQLLAAALAYKVLEPPERGWRRSPASVLAAAAFAGSREAIGEAALVEFSRRIAPHAGALDVILADAVIAGHVCGEPVVLHRPDPEAEIGLLVDTPGCFPLACADGIDPLLAILRRLGAPVVMISGESAAPRLLHDLDRAGLAFVTDAPPTRHECWRRVRQGTQTLGWTNSPEPGAPRVLGAARKLAAACAVAADLWQELAAARPGVVRAHSPGLDRNLTVAAGVAMGMAAWEMWQGSATVSPQETLRRYRDLDARVRFDSTSVLVRLPLGRRHRELDEAGLLRPIDGVPWLGGRRVEFGRG